MIVVVGGIKGGSGKTTVATNLSVIRAMESRDVLLIDADDQETASDFTALEPRGRKTAPGIPASNLPVRQSVHKLSGSKTSMKTSLSTLVGVTRQANELH